MEEKKTLYRNTDNKILGGVASGLAEYVGWDVTLVRLAFVFCIFTIPGSLTAYIIAWIIIPNRYNQSNNFSIGKLLLLFLVFAMPIVIIMTVFIIVFLGGLVPFF